MPRAIPTRLWPHAAGDVLGTEPCEPAWLWAKPRTEETPSRGAVVLHGCGGEAPRVEQGGRKVTGHAGKRTAVRCAHRDGHPPGVSQGPQQSPQDSAGTPGGTIPPRAVLEKVIKALRMEVGGREGMSREPAVEIGAQAPRLLRRPARVALGHQRWDTGVEIRPHRTRGQPLQDRGMGTKWMAQVLSPLEWSG